MSGAIYFVFSLSALPKSFQSSIGGLLHDSGYEETVREVRDQTLINSKTGRYMKCMCVCMLSFIARYFQGVLLYSNAWILERFSLNV